MTKPITVSLVSHGQFDMCVNLLSQLSQSCAQHIEQVFLVHNLPESRVLPQFHFPVRQIQNTQRLGFGANHNQVFAKVSTPYVLIVNPDIDLDPVQVDPFADLLLTLNSNNKIAVTAPVVLNPDGTVANSMRAAYTPLEVLLQRRHPHSVAPEKIVWFAGMFLLARVSALRQVRGFDEAYFMYCEDADLCVRLTKAGFAIKPTLTAKVIHSARRASHKDRTAATMHLRSALRFWWRALF
jgi:N-acetylglucosaminyl-diphospho-decaprenol L-rhamnosyltransferase